MEPPKYSVKPTADAVWYDDPDDVYQPVKKDKQWEGPGWYRASKQGILYRVG